MVSVRLHPEARAEYLQAYLWSKTQSTPAAERFEAELDQALGQFAASPGMFPSYDKDHRYARLRRYPDVLIYRPQGDEILVITVAHSSRSTGHWQGRN